MAPATGPDGPVGDEPEVAGVLGGADDPLDPGGTVPGWDDEVPAEVEGGGIDCGPVTVPPKPAVPGPISTMVGAEPLAKTAPRPTPFKLGAVVGAVKAKVVGGGGNLAMAEW
ncbi:MAG: hypothetical protein ACYCS7_04240 [Acidimicrobiales bacterium]